MITQGLHDGIRECLQNADAGRLAELGCYLGGETLAVLRHGEHRPTRRIWLVTSSRAGWQSIRRTAFSDEALPALFPGAEPSSALVRLPESLSQRMRWGGATMEVTIQRVAACNIDGHVDETLRVPVLETSSLMTLLFLANARRWYDPDHSLCDLVDIGVIMADRTVAAAEALEAAGTGGGKRVLSAFEAARRRFQMPPVEERVADDLDLDPSARIRIRKALKQDIPAGCRF